MVARGNVVGLGTALKAGRSQVRFPMVTGIFHSHNPSGRIVAVRSTQPLTKVPQLFPGGKGGQCVGLILPPSFADCHEIWSLNILEPSGPVQACPGLAFPTLSVAKLTQRL
jgi:hypothetical protein